MSTHINWSHIVAIADRNDITLTEAEAVVKGVEEAFRGITYGYRQQHEPYPETVYDSDDDEQLISHPILDTIETLMYADEDRFQERINKLSEPVQEEDPLMVIECVKCGTPRIPEALNDEKVCCYCLAAAKLIGDDRDLYW